jgi:hypothetical protein
MFDLQEDYLKLFGVMLILIFMIALAWYHYGEVISKVHLGSRDSNSFVPAELQSKKTTDSSPKSKKEN